MTRLPTPSAPRSYRQTFRRVLARIGYGTVLTIAVPLVAVFLWLRLYGLPEPVKNSLLAAIEQRHIIPFPVSVDRFLLDPTGAILARNVTVYRDANRSSILLQVDQIRVSIAWFSWWRGRGIVDGASISQADVRYPMGNETADFHDVNADVALDGHDIKIENADARFLNLALSVRGTIHNDGFPKTKPPTPEQLQQRGAILLSVLKALADIGTQQPIDVQLEFEASTRNLGQGRANFALESHDLTWRSAPVEELSIHGSLADGIVDLTDFKIGLERGDLTATGEWKIADLSAELQFTSSMDFTSLAPAFPGSIGQALGRLKFPNNAPGMTGRVLFNLRDGLHTDIQADLDWRDFTFNGVSFSQLTVPVAYDGRRLLVPGLKIVGQGGNVDLEFFFDGTKVPPSLQARISSTLDPTVLKGVFGEKMDRFLDSCAFHQGGPSVDATATGTALKTDAWTVTGKVSVAKFSYKDAAFDTVASDFTFADSKLSLPNLEVQRVEGKGSGGIIYDFKNRSVELRNLVTQVNVAEVAPMMGPKFTEYTKPYHFSRPPLVHANGKVDLQDQKAELDTNLVVEVQGRSPMEWTLFHVPYSFDNPNGTLVFKNRRLTVNMKKCGFYDGTLTGALDMDLRQKPAAYTMDIKLNKVNFKKFTVTTFHYGKSNGELTAGGHFTGAIDNMASMQGKGEARIENGDITQIPFLGSLTPLIPGFSIANSAHGDFTVNKGLISTSNMHITSLTLALIGVGNYDFIHDQLDLNMRFNAGAPLAPLAILAYPFSKIFEFHGSGPMKNAKWEPRNF